MIFVLATVRLLLLVSSVCPLMDEAKSLCKLLDGKDWKKLGLALVGRALLSKALIQLSAGGWGCTPSMVVVWPEDTHPWGPIVGLMVNSKRAYAKENLPVPPSRGEPLLAHTSTEGPPTLAGDFDSVSCGVTAPLLWVLMRAKFCLSPPSLESLFLPVLWESCNQIPLALKVRFSVDPQSLGQIARLGSLMWSSEPSQQCWNFFGISVLQCVGHLCSGYGI